MYVRIWRGVSPVGALNRPHFRGLQVTANVAAIRSVTAVKGLRFVVTY